MDTSIVQNFLAFGDPQETGALLEGLGPQLGHLFQLGPGREGTVLFPVGNDVLCSGGSQTGNLLQKRRGSSIGIHAHCIDAVLHHAAQGSIQLLLGAVVLVLSHADGLGVNFNQLCQRILQTACDGYSGAQIHIVFREFLSS